jgi:hypothetical protein
MPAARPSSNSARRRKSRRTARRNATVKRDRNFDRGRWTIGLTPTQWTRDWELRGIGSHRELVLKTSDHGAPQRDSFAKNTATFFAKACSWRSVATSPRRVGATDSPAPVSHPAAPSLVPCCSRDGHVANGTGTGSVCTIWIDRAAERFHVDTPWPNAVIWDASSRRAPLEEATAVLVVVVSFCIFHASGITRFLLVTAAM